MVKSDKVLEHLPAVPLLIVAPGQAAVVLRPHLQPPGARHAELGDGLEPHEGAGRLGVVPDVVTQAPVLGVTADPELVLSHHHPALHHDQGMDTDSDGLCNGERETLATTEILSQFHF